jgi:UDP-N-acetylglucosamine pyrophosphorylase
LKNGKPSIIEYSEIGETRAKELDEKGELKYNAANILNVMLRVDFLNRIVNESLDDLIKQYKDAMLDANGIRIDSTSRRRRSNTMMSMRRRR